MIYIDYLKLTRLELFKYAKTGIRLEIGERGQLVAIIPNENEENAEEIT